MTIWAGKVTEDNMGWAILPGDIVFYTDERAPNDGDICRIIIDRNGIPEYVVARVLYSPNGDIVLMHDKEEIPAELVAQNRIVAIYPLVGPFPNHQPPRQSMRR